MILNQLLPVVAIPAFLVLSARLRTRAFVSLACILIAALLVLSWRYPSVTTYYRDPKWAYGYESWVFPLAAAVVFGVLAVWRTRSRPRVVALLVCLPISFAICFLGAWVA